MRAEELGIISASNIFHGKQQVDKELDIFSNIIVTHLKMYYSPNCKFAGPPLWVHDLPPASGHHHSRLHNLHSKQVKIITMILLDYSTACDVKEINPFWLYLQKDDLRMYTYCGFIFK